MKKLLEALGEHAEAMRLDLERHWNTEPAWNKQEAACRKNGDFNLYWHTVISVAESRLKIGNTTVSVHKAELEFRPPMPYKTFVGGEILSEGVADGFIGIVGVFYVGGVERKLLSRQIGKPFYQYVPL